MSQNDARFEDASDRPLRLRSEDADDLSVVSALVQDAVFPGTEIAWHPEQRQFALLLNRFRWEDRDRAEKERRPVERVQSVLSFQDVLKVQSSGVNRGEDDMVLSVLALGFAPGEDGMGRVEITLAGDGAIALEVEAINVTLQDVTRPYVAPSHKVPEHGD
jgi:hypothetical protein